MFAGGTISEGELKARYERYKNIIDNFTLMSDIFMRNLEGLCMICIVKEQIMHSPVLAKRVHELKETQKGATAYVP